MSRKPLVLISLAALAIVGCKGGDSVGGASGDVLAVVNGESVPMMDYYRTMERSQLVTAVVNPNQLQVDPATRVPPVQVMKVQVQPSLGLQALRDCIYNTVLKQRAKDQGVYPTDDAVQKEIEFQQKRNANFVKDLNTNGFTVEQIKSEIALVLAKFNLQTKGATVTAADIDAYIKENTNKFTVPAQAALIMIEVPDEKTRDLAQKEIAEGQMFSAVAQHYSIQANAKALNYRYPSANVQDFPPILRTLIDKTKEFAATGWQRDPTTKHFVNFYVERKVPSKKMTIDDTIKELVRRELLTKKGSDANDLNKQMADALKASKIEIKVKYLDEPWKKAFAELSKTKEEPKTDDKATQPK